jgi:type I restriction enzyme S subunit
MMAVNTWTEVRIGDLGDVFTGRTPPTEQPTYFGDDFLFITPGDMHQGKYAYATKRSVSHEGAALLSRIKLPANSICVSCIGWQMGEVIMTAVPSFTNQQINTIIPNSKVVPSFLYYSLCTRKQELLSLGSSAGVRTPILNKSAFCDLKVNFPSLHTQRRIASILSAYDELIENNQRRIRILEEMVRRLYREWFVCFRYPGHKSVPLVESPLGKVPKGWEVTTLGKQLIALESGKRPKGGIRDVEDGVPSIGAENINGIGRHKFKGEKFVTREFFQKMNKGIVRNRDVAVYKDGAYIGKSSYFRDGFPHVECCVNEHVFLLRSNSVRLTQNILYLWLQEPDTVHAIRATNANAAQPGINQLSVGGLELVVPNEKKAAQFDCLVEPLFAEIVNFAKRSQNLRRTRNLLLPRLLSGKIDIDITETFIEKVVT